MKTKLMYPLALVVLYAFVGAVTARAQLATVTGKVTDSGKPLPGVQVIYKSMTNGRVIKIKTDKKGEFLAVGIPIDSYVVSVLDATGKELISHDKIAVSGGGDNVDNSLIIDITEGMTYKTGKGSSMGGGGALGGGQTSEFHGDENGATAKSGTTKEGVKYTKEEMAKMKEEHDKGVNMNALIGQYNAAQQAKNWQQASDVLKQMIAADPSHWDYQKALGDMQFNLGQYDEAVASYEKAAPLADAAKADPKTDQAKLKATLGQLYTNEGNSYLKLKKNPEAVAAFTKAAELDPNPGTAYFNLCATQYNTGNTDGALAACDKAIAADPNKADAYFIKGSLMMGASTMDKQGKLQAPAGTAEALNKYLAIDPSGSHAGDVKEMLAAIGAKVTTSYNEKAKKK
jgi:tetratricopeptide (TPR) repeat protein